MKKCKCCEHWHSGYFNVILRRWEYAQSKNSGNCCRPVMHIEVDGDAIVAARETEPDAFCSNFEWRGGTAPAETIPDHNRVAAVMAVEREVLKISWEEMAIRERTRWIRERYGSDVPPDLFAEVHNE